MDASIFDSALSHTRRSNASEKREENSVSTFERFRLWISFESSPVSVNEYFELKDLKTKIFILKRAPISSIIVQIRKKLTKSRQFLLHLKMLRRQQRPLLALFQMVSGKKIFKNQHFRVLIIENIDEKSKFKGLINWIILKLNKLVKEGYTSLRYFEIFNEFSQIYV